jgi:hypothetical protein
MGEASGWKCAIHKSRAGNTGQSVKSGEKREKERDSCALTEMMQWRQRGVKKLCGSMFGLLHDSPEDEKLLKKILFSFKLLKLYVFHAETVLFV